MFGYYWSKRISMPCYKYELRAWCHFYYGYVPFIFLPWIFWELCIKYLIFFFPSCPLQYTSILNFSFVELFSEILYLAVRASTWDSWFTQALHPSSQTFAHCRIYSVTAVVPTLPINIYKRNVIKSTHTKIIAEPPFWITPLSATPSLYSFKTWAGWTYVLVKYTC